MDGFLRPTPALKGPLFLVGFCRSRPP